MAQQTIAVNLIGSSSALTGELRKASKSWRELDVAMGKVMRGQVQYNGELGRFTNSNGRIVTSLGGMRKRLEEVKLEKARLAATVAALSKEFSQEELEILGLSGALQQVNMGMKATHAGAGTAQFAVTSLGQAFADAGQFGMGMSQGIRAVNNNIQQVAQAIMMTTAATGGLSKGFKAMWASMMGPSGVLLAFFAVTAAVEAWTNVAQRAEKEANGIADSFSGMFEVIKKGDSVQIASSKRLEDYRDGLKALSQESLEIANSQLNVVHDRLTGSTFISTALNEEGRAALEASEQYERLSESLREQIEDAKNYEAALEAREKSLGINGIRVEDLTAKNELLATRIRELAVPMSDEARALDEQNKKLQQQADFLQLLADARANMAKITADRMSKVAAELEDAYPDLPELTHKDLELRGFVTDAMNEQSAGLRTAVNNLNEFDKQIDATIKGVRAARAAGNERLAQDLIWDSMPDPSELDLGDKLETEASKVEDAAARLQVALSKQIGGAVADFAVSIASSDGGFKSFGDKVKGSLGSLMVSLGKSMIQFGTAGIAIKKFVTNPYLAFAAGSALVALGSRLAQSAQKSVSSGLGGGGGGGSMAAPGYTVPDRSIFAPGATNAVYGGNSATSVTGRFVVEGRDLVAVVQSESSFQQEMGISNNLVIGG
jgi:hypothetical protein